MIVPKDSPIQLPEFVIEPGMHFALETYHGEGENGARLEEQLIVTEDGARVITKFPIEELLVCAPI